MPADRVIGTNLQQAGLFPLLVAPSRTPLAGPFAMHQIYSVGKHLYRLLLSVREKGSGEERQDPWAMMSKSGYTGM